MTPLGISSGQERNVPEFVDEPDAEVIYWSLALGIAEIRREIGEFRRFESGGTIFEAPQTLSVMAYAMLAQTAGERVLVKDDDNTGTVPVALQ